MKQTMNDIKAQGPQVISKSPLWLFLTKDETKEDEKKEKTLN